VGDEMFKKGVKWRFLWNECSIYWKLCM